MSPPLPCHAPVLFLAALLWVQPLPAAPQTQLQLNEQTCGEFQRADVELNRVWKEIQAKYRGEKQFLAKLREAQRAWLRFRDTQLEAMYPGKDKRSTYGSIYETCRCSALTELTRQRLAQLKRWSDGVLEGDVCAGSAHTR